MSDKEYIGLTLKKYQRIIDRLTTSLVNNESQIKSLQQQNQELREELRIEKNKNYNCPAQLGKEPMNEACGGCVGCVKMQEDHYHNKQLGALKAFIKEACEVIEFYGDECFTTIEGSYGRSYQNYHVVTYEDIEGKGEDQSGGKRARAFMNTDKYKQFTKEN